MKRIIYNDNLYPTIFKEHLLLKIANSSYKDNIFIEDVKNLTISSNLIMLNTYTINRFFKELLKNDNDDINFKVNKINMIYHTKTIQKYKVELLININNTNWFMNVFIESFINLTGQNELIHLPKLKKRLPFKCLTNEEKLAKMFYQIINETYETFEIFYDFYSLYYSKIEEESFLIALEKIYTYTNEKIKIKTQQEKVDSLRNNKFLYSRWNRLKQKRTDIKINLVDIQYCLNDVLTKLKERVI